MTSLQENTFNETRNFLPTTAVAQVPKKIKLKNVMQQVLASCIIHCIVIQAGVNMAYSTVLIKGLEINDANLTATEDEQSWIASVVTLSLPLGSLIAGPLMDKLGRKTICLISCVPVAISWLLLIVANSVTFIYVARIIAGTAAGLTTVGLVYVSEITHPQIRPMLLCLNSVFVSLGILITCCLAVALNWRNMAIVFLVLQLCIFFALCFVPESPYWLMYFNNGMYNQKRIHKAEKSLKWLNKNEAIYEQEYSRIKETCHSNVAQEKPSNSLVCWQSLKKPSVYKPIIILFFLLLLQQLSGAYVIIFYAISVFHDIGGTFGEGLNENSALVMLGVIRFAMSILTVHLSKKYGRRTLCICSGLGMAFSMFFSAMYMYLTSSYDENGGVREVMAEQKWILLIIVLLFVCMSSLGFIIIPWTLIGELLPVSVRGVGGGIMVAIAYVMMSGVVKGYPYAVKVVSMQGMCFFFSFVSLLATGFVYFFLPETLGKSFVDIENYFMKKNNTLQRHINSITS